MSCEECLDGFCKRRGKSLPQPLAHRCASNPKYAAHFDRIHGVVDPAVVPGLPNAASGQETNRSLAVIQSGGRATTIKTGGCGAPCGGTPSPPPAKRPGTLTRLHNLAAATARYLADDRTPTPADVLDYRESCCTGCPQNVDDECRLCGCPLHANAMNNGKLAWRSEQCSAGRWFRHHNSRVPFTREPTRHLIYHVYPRVSPKIGGRVWRWNLDLLARRIDLFNGKRLVAVATDENSESADAVRDYLWSVGIECDVTEYANNSKSQEMVSFVDQLAAVKSLDQDDIVFRAHAKGVKHDNFFDGSGRRPWVEALYATGLDDLPAIDDALESHVTAGAFRFHKAFNGGKTWAYCGSFYWFRAKDIFARKWSDVQGKFWGVEEFPGRIAKIEEAACLLHDFTTQFTALADLKKWDSEGIWSEVDTWCSIRGLPLIAR